MDIMKRAIQDFFNADLIAVAGVSRNKDQVANGIFRKFQKAGYDVIPVNPKMTTFEGLACYPEVSMIPQAVDSVFICTHPRDSASVVSDCVKAGVKRIWFHRSIDSGSFSDEAFRLAKQSDIQVIPRGCPMMYIKPVDPFHWCFRKILQFRGKLPSLS